MDGVFCQFEVNIVPLDLVQVTLELLHDVVHQVGSCKFVMVAVLHWIGNVNVAVSTQSPLSELMHWEMGFADSSLKDSEPLSFWSPREPKLEIIVNSIIWKEENERLKQNDVQMKSEKYSEWGWEELLFLFCDVFLVYSWSFLLAFIQQSFSMRKCNCWFSCDDIINFLFYWGVSIFISGFFIFS